MDQDSLDLNGLSRSFTRNSVLISHAGVDQSFSVYQHALTSHFSRNPSVWKINNKPFPHRLTFPLKFVPYEEKLCFGPQISPTEITKIAYLHIFNINVTSADDYRANVRHNVSDWFAKLNSKPDVQWIIVINTTRAKDRKTKTAIMEKIKTDFAKYIGRLFELPDTSDQTAFVAFVQGIQQFLFTHLNLVMEIWDKSLKTAYERRKQHSWEPFAYFSSMTEYGRMFWSFGAIEYCISIFDDLEQLLHDFVLRSAEPDSPKWLAQMLNTKVEDRPSVLGNFSVQRLQKKEAHYLGMRNYLLCQQIVMAVHLYQHKMKSNDAAPSLRSDCAVDILKRALITIEAVKEFNSLMNNKRDVAITCCWTWWTVSESIQICQLLCDISHLNIAPIVLSRLQLARFDALYVLAKQMKLNPDDAEQLGEWLELQKSSESKVLKNVLGSTEQMCVEIEKAHDVCVSALHHSNRHRFVLHINYKLFSYLKSVNAKCPHQKIAIGRQVLKTMPAQPTTANLLKNLCSELINSDSMSDEILSLIFFISQCEQGKDDEINGKFLKRCEERAEKPLDLRSICDEELFKVQIENFEAVQTTDSTLEVRCILDSKLGFALKNAKARLHFSGDPASSVAQAPDLSVLSLQYEKKENVCRLVSELKLKNQSQQSANEENEQKLVVESEEIVVEVGENQINFKAPITKIGCFVLEKVSISTDSLFFDTPHVITRRPPALYCISTPHSVSALNDSQHFYAGVMQDLEIEVEAMCPIAHETTLEIEASTEKFQFLKDGEWGNDLQLALRPFESLETRVIHVQIWLKIDSSICESASVQKRSVRLGVISSARKRRGA
ncbi:unnamed protein product [Caenorhabditis sp. 36 PRJEB53466]|nr:unnamed protein product [Caenorhabditis sp. 36 PRJEB53466]